MNHGSLFSGIGGFDLAAEWMGWNNVFHCEWMPFPRQVLKYHFPNSICYEDITKTDFTIHRGTIDVWKVILKNLARKRHPFAMEYIIPSHPFGGQIETAYPAK